MVSHLLVKIILLFFVSVLLCLPLSTIAADDNQDTQKFTPLVELPQITDEDANIQDYVNGLYTLSITAAVLLVIVKIIGAGAGYVMSDVVTTKEQSKKDIRNALIGLLIILAAVTILNEINPNLKRLDILSGVEGVTITGDNSGSSASQTNSCQQDPNQTGCNQQYQTQLAECDAKGGVMNRSNTGDWYCDVGNITPQTNYGWEVVDTNILSFFEKRCGNNTNCSIVFVGEPSDNENEQMDYCDSVGGTFDSGTYTTTSTNYNYCIK